MVTQKPLRRDTPAYALSRVRELAAEEAVSYASSRVQHDADGLGYSFEAVCQCLSQLEENDFHHSEQYADSRIWLDVYLIRYEAPNGAIDDLYIKLKLNKNCICVVLCSFHRERDI